MTREAAAAATGDGTVHAKAAVGFRLYDFEWPSLTVPAPRAAAAASPASPNKSKVSLPFCGRYGAEGDRGKGGESQLEGAFRANHAAGDASGRTEVAAEGPLLAPWHAMHLCPPTTPVHVLTKLPRLSICT